MHQKEIKPFCFFASEKNHKNFIFYLPNPIQKLHKPIKSRQNDLSWANKTEFERLIRSLNRKWVQLLWRIYSKDSLQLPFLFAFSKWWNKSPPFTGDLNFNISLFPNKIKTWWIEGQTTRKSNSPNHSKIWLLHVLFFEQLQLLLISCNYFWEWSAPSNDMLHRRYLLGF